MSPDQFKLYFCYAVIIVLTAVVIGLSVALSDLGNWTSSQNSCVALEAHLARFDNMEELDFLKRYSGHSDYWIGLHRESAQHHWKWTDNNEYNNLVPIRGEGECAYLSDGKISSSRMYVDKMWICSKPKSYLQCPEVSQFVSKQL